MAKLTQNKNIKNNYLEYLLRSKMQPTTTETVHNDFFRNKKSKRNKKQAEPKKKRKPNRLGSDFLKK